MLYHCCIFCFGNSPSGVFFSPSFSSRQQDKVRAESHNVRFSTVVGRCSQLKLPLCHFNSAAVSCMTCASPIRSRRRVRSQLREATHHCAVTVSVRPRGKRRRAQICVRGAISTTEVWKPCQSYGEDGSALLSSTPIRHIRLIGGAFQPRVIFRPVFSKHFALFPGTKGAFHSC